MLREMRAPIGEVALFVLLIQGCTTEVTKYRDVESVTHREVEVPYLHSRQVPVYKTIPRVFPLPADRPMLLAVLPFTSSTGSANAGVEISEEVEYGMLKHPDAQRTYKLLNRTQLSAVFTERELSGLDMETIKKTRSLLNVEGLISGHVRAKSDTTLSFILKAIDTRDASVLFTQRFEGEYEQCISEVVSVFYDNRALAGYRTVFDTLYRKELQPIRGVRKESYTATVDDPQMTWLLILVSAFAITVAVVASIYK